MDRPYPTRLVCVLNWVAVFILVIMPFHEFVTTWLASNFGHLDLLRAWKEIVILICLPFVFYLIFRNARLRKSLTTDYLYGFIVVYALTTIILGLWAYHTKRVNSAALAYGLIIDLRFLAFFIFTVTIAFYSDYIKNHWRQILIIPAVLVIIFGIAQLFLPYNFLSHFGYGAKTIPAYSTVDQKIAYRRIQSTLRGADPLGAYLVLIIPAILLGLSRRAWLKLVLLAASLVVLYFTYSRSAWLGLLLSAVLLFGLFYLKPIRRKKFLIGSLLIIVLASVAVVGLRHNLAVEDIFFHTSATSESKTSSNAAHLSAWRSGFDDLIHQPFGDGTGTAGPASEHNDHPARIAENYYLQIGQETGFLGLLLFLGINVIVAFRLYKMRQSNLAILLLVSFIGISLVNLFAHEWADDTLSLIWWGLAGVVLSPDIIKKSLSKQKISKLDEKAKKLKPAQQA